MDEDLNAKANEINAKVEEAVQGLTEQGDAVKSALEEAKSRLKSLTE